MKVYDVNYFIKKFSAIPNEKWTKDKFTDGHGRYCALGHCGYSDKNPVGNGVEGYHLTQMFDHYAIRVACVNDGDYSHVLLVDNRAWYWTHTGKTPKERILNFLYTIKSGILNNL